MKPLTDRELEDRYTECLNDAYGFVKICGFEYSASHALALVDPVAFCCGFSDWLSSEIGETIEEIDGEYYEKERS